jgi:hypothetical protein
MAQIMAKKNLSAFRFLWVTDPWPTLDHAKDTTMRLAQEAALLGYGSYWCDVKSIRFEERRTWVEAAPVGSESLTGEVPPTPIQSMDITSFSSIHYRVDPPVAAFISWNPDGQEDQSPDCQSSARTFLS